MRQLVLRAGAATLLTISAGCAGDYIETEAGQVSDDAQSEAQALSATAVVTGGGFHSCRISTGGTVQCWGSNASGQLGDGTTTSASRPVAVSGLTGVVDLAAGRDHTCALKSDQTVWCWGSNGSGQLGDGSTATRKTPVKTSISGVTQIAAGAYHTCARKSDGTAWCWGYNYYGQLGDGTSTNRSVPVRVQSLTGVTQVATGGAQAFEGFSCALKNDGSAWCWGYNNYGQLGDGTYLTRKTPGRVVQQATWTSLTAGGSHACALDDAGNVWCWGDDRFSQLGDLVPFTGDGDDWSIKTGPGTRATPGLVAGIADASTISAGRDHTCGVRIDGAVLCWGKNTYGQLGKGDQAEGDFATQVVLPGLAAGVGLGQQHSCARSLNGTTWCWGANHSGQLGDGTTTNRTTPVPVN